MGKYFFGFVIASFFSLSLPAWAEKGTAVIQGTQEGSNLSGVAHFEDTSEGLKISANLTNVPLGKHGFHIHQLGDCGDQGNAAGGHYNPDGVPHGYVLKDGLAAAHAGDLGNIEIAPDGSGKLDAVIPGVNLSGGKYSVAGRSLILHEKEDDFGQPTGNAGARIGCGAIRITKE